MPPKIVISDEDCQKVLKNSPLKEHQYSSKELLPFTEGRSGVLGEHFKLKLKLKETPQKLKCFVKRVSEFNRKEEGFYGKILPAFFKYNIEIIKEITPKCFYIKTAEYIVLEDLKRRGFESVRPQVLLNLNQVQCVLVALAKYHAASIIYEIKKGVELNQEFELNKEFENKEFQLYKEFSNELQEVYYCEYPGSGLLASIKYTIKSQVNLFEEILCKKIPKENLIKYLEELFDTIKDYPIPSKKYKNVICHGDLWQSNLMFSSQSDEMKILKCMIIDEQMIRYCPPAVDVMGFLYLTTDREFKQTHMDKLLNDYYDALRDELDKYQIYCDTLIPKEEFLNSCEFYKLFAIMQAFSYAQITCIPSELFQKIMGGEDGKTRFLFESRASVVEKLCRDEADYKKRQLEVLLDFVEFIEINNKKD